LPEHYRQSSQLVSETEIDGIPLVVIDVPYDNKMSFDQRIDAFLRFAVLATREAMSRSADVVFATSTPLSIAIPGLFAALKQRIPLVFEVRDLWPELPIAMGALRNPAACVVARLLEWLAYHGSAHVVALSPGMAEGVVSRGIAPGRVTVIPNSCDTDSFEVPPEYGHTFRSKLPDLAPEQPLVVYTGTFGQINGVGYLVAVAEAMQRIDPSVRFLLVGAGAEKEQVTEEARACGVFGKNLWIWDSIPKTQMPSLLSASTVPFSYLYARCGITRQISSSTPLLRAGL
jgi:glycosyltransferase involved in cell wall biosynthesis